MTLMTGWDLFEDLRAAQEEMMMARALAWRAGQQRDSAAAAAAWAPAVDISERKDAYLVAADLPGVKTGDVEITFEDGLLTDPGPQGTGSTGQADHRACRPASGRSHARHSGRQRQLTANPAGPQEPDRNPGNMTLRPSPLNTAVTAGGPVLRRRGRSYGRARPRSTFPSQALCAAVIRCAEQPLLTVAERPEAHDQFSAAA